MPGGMTRPIRVIQTNALPSSGFDLHLTDDCALKANNHFPADDLTPHHEVPAFVERLEELVEVQLDVLARSSGDNLLRLVGRNVRRARGGVILKSTTTKGGLL
jgi:hypothetical protein